MSNKHISSRVLFKSSPRPHQNSRDGINDSDSSLASAVASWLCCCGCQQASQEPRQQADEYGIAAEMDTYGAIVDHDDVFGRGIDEEIPMASSGTYSKKSSGSNVGSTTFSFEERYRMMVGVSENTVVPQDGKTPMRWQSNEQKATRAPWMFGVKESSAGAAEEAEKHNLKPLKMWTAKWNKACKCCGLDEVCLKEFIQCDLCPSVFHPLCLDPKERKMKQYNPHWACKACISNWSRNYAPQLQCSTIDWNLVQEWTVVY